MRNWLQLVGEREIYVLAPTLEIREQKRVLSLAEWEKHYDIMYVLPWRMNIL